MPRCHILVIDDERPNLESLEKILRHENNVVQVFQDPRDALSTLKRGSIDIIITDFKMNNLSGMEVLSAVKLIDPTIQVVLMTAFGTVEIAVEAMKRGAYDFITKPLQRLSVLKVVQKAWETRQLVHENLSLREELKNHHELDQRTILGRSESVTRMMEVVSQAAKSQASVLIEGESGTGKGLLAEHIHRHSHGAHGIFVKINCTAIPENLLEAELFGYEPGAFTGANKRKKGRVELAEGGTLFLDEIGIAPLTFQAKLLRFLQDGEFERLGSNETLRVRTRVISATNADLKKAILQGQLREDLFYRLNVIHIRMPTLRERQADIPLLAQKFTEDSARKNGRELPMIDSAAMDCFVSYPWPGNIRELQNLMERLVVLNRSGVIQLEDLPPEISGCDQKRNLVIPLGMPLRAVEQMVIEETLRSTKGDKRLAAGLLGVHPRTIHRFLEGTCGLESETGSEGALENANEPPIRFPVAS